MPRQDIFVDLYYDGEWQDVTTDVLTRSPINITRGLQNEAQDTPPGRLSLTFKDTSGKYNPANPTSPLYGKVGRNTPIRVVLNRSTVSASDTFTRSVTDGWGTSSSGHVWSTAANVGTIADYDVTGTQGTIATASTGAHKMAFLETETFTDMDVYAEFNVALATGDNLEPTLMLRGQGLTTYYMARANLVPTTNAVNFSLRKIVDNVDTEIGTGSTGVTHAAATTLKIRARIVGNVLQARAWQGSSEPTTWHATATDVGIVGRGWAGVRTGNASGNTNVKPVVYTVDNFQLTGWDVRFVGEVASWTPKRNLRPGTDPTCEVVAAGILRRMSQGTKPIPSPPMRAVPLEVAGDLVAFWPLEDGPDSTFAASGISGGTPLTLTGSLGFGQGSGLTGSPNILDTNQGGGTLYVPITGVGSSAFGIEFTVRYPSTHHPSVSPTLMDIYFTGGTCAHMYIYADPYVYALPYDATETGFGAACRSEVEVYDSRYRLYQLDVEQIGADVRLTWYIDGEFVTTGTFLGQETYAGKTMGQPVGLYINPAGNTQGMPALGYLALYNGTTPTWSNGVPHLGYPGELAGDRFVRIAEENSVPYVVVGDQTDTLEMGPQPADTVLNVLKDCVKTDAGTLFEPINFLGVGFRTNRSMYNQDAEYTLDYPTDGLMVIDPVLDDQNTRNDVTAKQLNGSFARVVDETTSMSIQDPPDGVGRYDVQITVNVADDTTLENHAGWAVHLGTVEEPRYPSATLNIAANADLADVAYNLDVGDKITITGMPDDITPNDLSLLVMGFKERIPSHLRDVTLFTVPASPHEVGVVGETAGTTVLRGQAVDIDGSTLSSGITTTGTSLSVASTGGVLWTTISSNWSTGVYGSGPSGAGLFIEIGGEIMRVTNITGGSSPQTFTVVRSVNGVVKTHSSGAQVNVAYPITVAH